MTQRLFFITLLVLFSAQYTIASNESFDQTNTEQTQKNDNSKKYNSNFYKNLSYAYAVYLILDNLPVDINLNYVKYHFLHGYDWTISKLLFKITCACKLGYDLDNFSDYVYNQQAEKQEEEENTNFF